VELGSNQVSLGHRATKIQTILRSSSHDIRGFRFRIETVDEVEVTPLWNILENRVLCVLELYGVPKKKD
jgi:hypothetical protein